MFRKIVIVALLFSFLIQCTDQNESFDNADLIKSFKTAGFEDNIQFGNINLSCSESNLIATDQRANRIHQLSYNTLDLLKSVGKEGRGPEEFNGIYYADSYNGDLFVSDAGN
jgi:hypothetical protein